MKFYTMIVQMNEGNESPNFRQGEPAERLKSYLNCAAGLASSLRAAGYELCVLTNEMDTIERLGFSPRFEVQQFLLNLNVPSNIRFRAAHYKLDAMRWISEFGDKYSILCDPDMICLNTPNENFLANEERQRPMNYDISNQVVPAYGFESIKRDLQLLGLTKAEVRWSGGEFIAGPPEFFQRLSEKARSAYARYLSSLDDLHHIGDETLTSYALQEFKLDGMEISDAGSLDIVRRHWTSTPAHKQVTWRVAKQATIIHLPADKLFLSWYGRRQQFRRRHFVFYFRIWRIMRSVRNIARRILNLF